MEIPSDYPKPKLCTVKKRSDFKGYGFNLQSEKGKKGQVIGKVEPGSPAEESGLVVKDVIIEVNGVNVENEPHQRVVELAKSNPQQVEMFVCAQSTINYCRENAIRLTPEGPQPLKAKEQQASSSADAPAAAAAVGGDVAQKQQQLKVEQNAGSVKQQAADKKPQQPKQKQQQQQQGSSKDPVGDVSMNEVMSRVGNNKRTQIKQNNASFTEKYSVFESL